MITQIHNLLTPEKITVVQSVLAHCDFVDGKASAGDVAAQAKHNEEASLASDRFDALNDIVMSTLVVHPDYLHAAMPARLAAPLYVRYSKGMHYGEHIDDPLMGVQPRYRTDVSITLFLNDPSEYEGGELCIKTPYGEKDFKLPAGSALLYPASSRHSVKEVKSGTRLVAVTWLQSMVRNPECREILFQLAKARDLLASDTESEAYKRVETGYANLVRLWADV